MKTVLQGGLFLVAGFIISGTLMITGIQGYCDLTDFRACGGPAMVTVAGTCQEGLYFATYHLPADLVHRDYMVWVPCVVH